MTSPPTLSPVMAPPIRVNLQVRGLPSAAAAIEQIVARLARTE